MNTSVQCAATCHDLHSVCYGRCVEVDLVKERGEKMIVRLRSETCACACHKS